MTSQKADELRSWIVEQLEGEHATFLNVVNAMPDDMLTYAPDDRVMDFGTLARHVAGSGAFFLTSIQNGKVDMSGDKPEPPPLPAKTSDLVDEIAGMFKSTIEGYKSLTPDQLAKSMDFCGMGEHPGVVFLNWDLVHIIHHRAQLGLYLRLSGQKVPSVYGPTLDVSFEDMMSSK